MSPPARGRSASRHHSRHGGWLSPRARRVASWALLAMAPAAIGVHLFAPERQLLLFLVSALGIVPLAGAIGRSTERLAHRLG